MSEQSDALAREASKKENLNRMMIEANAYMQEKDYLYGTAFEHTGKLAEISRLQAQKDDGLDLDDRELDGMQLKQEDLQRILDAMLTDMASQEALKDKYPDLYREAKSKEQYMNTVAGYGTFEKLENGVSWRQRKAARDWRSRIENGKKELKESRIEKLWNRKKYFQERLELQESRNRLRLRELEDKKDVESDAEMDAIEESMRVIGRSQYEKKDFDRISVFSMMKSCIRSGDKAIRRKTAEKLAEKTAAAHDETAAIWEKYPFATQWLPVLCEQEALSDSADLMVRTAQDVETLRKKSGQEDSTDEFFDLGTKEQDQAFDSCLALMKENHRKLYEAQTAHRELFEGNVHPDSLMFHSAKHQGFTVNDADSGSDTFEILEDMQTRVIAMSDLVETMRDSPCYTHLKVGYLSLPEEERKKKDDLDGIALYVRSMREYLKGLMGRLEEWDRFYSFHPKTDEASYVGRSFTDVMTAVKRGKMGL